MAIPSGTPAGLTPEQVNYSDTSQWRQFVRQSLATVRTAIPAFLVENLDPAKQTVTVQIAIQERVRTTVGAQWWDVPPIVNVPIVTPRGGGFSVTLPLKKGDSGLLVFCYTCFDNWWQKGVEDAPKAQNTDENGKPTLTKPSGSQTQFEVRRHWTHDCGFIPGMWSQKDLLEDYSTDSLQIRSDDGNTIIDVSADGVEITGDSVEARHNGTAVPLMNDHFFQWYLTNIQPFLISKGYLGPPIPSNSETTILKGE